MNVRTGRGLTALVLVALIAACGGGDDSSTAADEGGGDSGSEVYAGPAADLEEGLSELAAAAEAGGEDEVVVAIWNGEEEIYQKLKEQFEEAYPDFEVTLKSVDFIQMGAIVQSEIDAGQRTADVVTNAFMALKPMLDAGTIDTEIDYAALGIPEERIAEDGFIYQSDGLCTSVVYNPEVVDEADLPESMEGFADPKWKDMLATLPSNGVACMGFYALKYGLEETESLVADMKDNGLLFSDNAEQLMTSGERPVLVFHYSLAAPFLEAKDAPVAEKLYPGTGVFQTRAAIVTETPSPNLARLFSAWLVGPDAAKSYEDYYAGGLGFARDPSSQLVARTKDLGADLADEDFFVYETIDNFTERAEAADALRSAFIGG